MIAFIQAMGWTLIHSLWQFGLIGLLAAPLLGRLRNPAFRQLVAAGALGLAVLISGGTFLRLRTAERAPVLMALATQDPALARQPDASISSGPWKRRSGEFLRPGLPWLVLLWLLGVLGMSLRLGAGWWITRRWRHQARSVPDELAELFQNLARNMGLQRIPRLRLSDRVDTPLVIGLLRPVILLPAGLLTGLPGPYLEALLAHELAHIRHWDALVNHLQCVVEVLFFYHPVIWWLSRRIRTERELLADDRAASALALPDGDSELESRRRLAKALNALDDLQHQSLALAATGGPLLNRIQRLLLLDAPTPRFLPAWASPLLLSTLLLAPLGALESPKSILDAPPELVLQVDALAAQEKLDPDLLRAMVWAESRFNPKAQSPMGARGLLQVLPATSRRFGATDPDNPEQVAAAGARYLRWLLDRYEGDISKAVAAYNCGEKALESGQITEEALRYRSLVLQLREIKAVQPESPLEEGEIRGHLRMNAEGNACQLSLRLKYRGKLRVDVLPEAEDSKPWAQILTGNPSESTELQESRPRITFPMPKDARFRIRATTDEHIGEYTGRLQEPLHIFRFTLAPRRQP